jgi:hypothetical protein
VALSLPNVVLGSIESTKPTQCSIESTQCSIEPTQFSIEPTQCSTHCNIEPIQSMIVLYLVVMFVSGRFLMYWTVLKLSLAVSVVITM